MSRHRRHYTNDRSLGNLFWATIKRLTVVVVLGIVGFGLFWLFVTWFIFR